jgi:hypothetical protein
LMWGCEWRNLAAELGRGASMLIQQSEPHRDCRLVEA